MKLGTTGDTTLVGIGEEGPARRGVRPIDGFFIAAIVSVGVAWVMTDYRERAKAQDYARAVDATVADPGYGALAARAGYRVERGMLQDLLARHVWVVARCVRSNDAGPLRCDDAPRPAGKVGETLEVIPPDALQKAHPRG